MNRLGERVTRQEAENMIKEVDTKGDGRVSQEEFLRVIDDNTKHFIRSLCANDLSYNFY